MFGSFASVALACQDESPFSQPLRSSKKTIVRSETSLMRIVIALGGNALLRKEQPLTAASQRHNAQQAAQQIAPLTTQHQVLLSHGNGPQVGLLALQALASNQDPTAWPLDVLGSESAGMIGYILEQELRSALPQQEIATLLSPIAVDAEDPAFSQPTKPIGPYYEEAQALALQSSKGWTFTQTPQGHRRTVPSPIPQKILGLHAIKTLVDARITVICTGGGGIPVIQHPDGRIEGVEAVIDKDLASALLAQQLHADALIMLTDIDAVYADWNTPQARALQSITPEDIDLSKLPAGSMRPKVQAALQFVQQGGRFAAIGALEQLQAILEGQAGTRITKETIS